MSQLFLPAEHTDADLFLATAVAERMASGELYVTWTPADGQVVPAVAAELRMPAPQWTDTLALVFGVVREIWLALLSRPETTPVSPKAPQPAPAVEPQPER